MKAKSTKKKTTAKPRMARAKAAIKQINLPVELKRWTGMVSDLVSEKAIDLALPLARKAKAQLSMLESRLSRLS